MPGLRVATWNIAGARREQTNQVDLDAVVAGVRTLGVDLLAVQEVDRQLARSGRADQPAVIAQALGAGWFWSYAPALVGDDFRPLSGPDPGGPAYGNLLVSQLPPLRSRWSQRRHGVPGSPHAAVPLACHS
jgi:endonuclease/exonuclease/phosphatase family metal-dependent hydrolase